MLHSEQLHLQVSQFFQITKQQRFYFGVSFRCPNIAIRQADENDCEDDPDMEAPPVTCFFSFLST